MFYHRRYVMYSAGKSLVCRTICNKWNV